VYHAYLNRGGEDEVFDDEAALLEANGHRVHRLRVEADPLREPSRPAQARIAAGSIWSRRGYRVLEDALREHRPEVVHFHNTFPLLSPSAYVAARRSGAAVVHTLHNYRMVCPANTLFRDGRPCDDCVGRAVPLPAVRHACYHGSRAQTAVITAMLSLHRARGTWRDDIHLYLTPTEFARQQFIRGGVAAEQIAVKPNFVDHDPPPRSGPGSGFLVVGRLVGHKGIATVLDAWRSLPAGIELHVIGDGPMSEDVRRAAAELPDVHLLGRQPREVVLAEMQAARAFLFPSTWYETFGITVVEAYASSLPVIASDIGPVGAELVTAGETGLLVPPGDAAALAEQVRWAWAHPAEMAAMGEAARARYASTYTGAATYRVLVDLYERAIERAAQA
jgi:glycosyltransferase involved in cell wall biosynthesis